MDSLDEEREDGLPPGIVGELLPVVAVLSQGPEGHLVRSGEAEQSSWNMEITILKKNSE